MSLEFDPEEAAGNSPPINSKEYNQRLLDSLFSEGLSEDPWSFVKDYVLRMLKISEEAISSRQSVPSRAVAHPVLTQATLRGIIGHYLDSLGWCCALEVPADDVQDSHKFDVLAEKDFNTVIVEVKPDIDVQYLSQLSEYISKAKRNFRRVRVFLGTDVANIHYLFSGDDITDVLMEYATRYQLGVIFVNEEQFWLVPAEFLLINTDF